jgi:hypothetical protein
MSPWVTKPTIESWLMLKPAQFRPASPTASDRGIETITTAEARKPRGSRVSRTSAIAIAKSRVKPARRCATFAD